MAWRDANPGSQILDIPFADVANRDTDVVKAIYDTFSLMMTHESQQAMQDWSIRNPRNKHGSHAYTAEMFGTTDDAIRQRFAAYIERFGPLL